MFARLGRHGLVGAVWVASLLRPAFAHAYEASVDAQTSGQAYQLRGLSGSPILSRRRVTQTLQLSVHHVVQDPSRDAGADGGSMGGRPLPTLDLRVRLRLDPDFGLSREEWALDGAPSVARYVPLLQPAPLDVMTMYVEGRRYLRGVLGFKLGRQYLVDPLGYYAFDGLLVRVDSPVHVGLEGYAGFEVRGALPFSTDTAYGRWELGGVTRMDRSSLPESSHPSIQPLSLAPVFGATLETTGWTAFHARATYRKAYNTGQAYVASSLGRLLPPSALGIYDATRVASERLGLALDGTVAETWLLRGQASYDLYSAQPSTAEVGSDLRLGKRVTFGVEYAYFRPVFDADSIFNVFGIEPMEDVRTRVDVSATERLDFAVECLGRLQRSYRQVGSTEVSVSASPGANLTGRYRWAGSRVVVRGSGLAGRQGHRVGVDVAYDRSVTGRLSVDGRVSLWDFRDQVSSDPRSTTSVGYVAGAAFRFTPEARGTLQFEHDINRLVGMRYRLLAMLDVKVWL